MKIPKFIALLQNCAIITSFADAGGHCMYFTNLYWLGEMKKNRRKAYWASMSSKVLTYWQFANGKRILDKHHWNWGLQLRKRLRISLQIVLHKWLKQYEIIFWRKHILQAIHWKRLTKCNKPTYWQKLLQLTKRAWPYFPFIRSLARRWRTALANYSVRVSTN